MGVAHSTEATLTAVVLAGILGLGYHYYYTTPGAGVDATTSSTDANSVKKSKKKKKKGLEDNNKSLAPTPSSTSQLVDSSNTIPGQFDRPLTPTTTLNSKAKKPKKRASVKHLPNKPPPPSSTTPQPPASPKTADDVVHKPSETEGSWTRVVSRRKQGADSNSVDVTTSDAGLTSSVTGNSSPVEEAEEPSPSSSSSSKDKLQTLAEKLVPKAPPTQVDELSLCLRRTLFGSLTFHDVSMLADHNQPTLSRVMRVQPLPDEKPAPGFSWRDYEDVDADGEDDGWGVVKSSKRSRPPREVNAASTSTTAPSGGGSQTKKQRQNEKKREAQKAAKVAAENDRLATLAKHKRELEKTRIIEQSRSGGKTSKVSGGMAPMVDAAGKLVWE